MVFSSSIFLCFFFPLFLFFYYLTDKKYKNFFLLFASIVFYSWGAPKFIFVIIGTTILDFYFVRMMYNSKACNLRRLLLLLSISMNLGLLFYFKYCNFFIENVNTLLGSLGMEGQINFTKLALPIGISFYTFETLTYVVDVYRGVHKPLNNFWDYQLYIILFPKLIAGPIIRYHEIADQITDRSANDTINNKLHGFYRFCIGLGKKVMIANSMAVVANSVYGDPETMEGALHPLQISAGTAWIGALAYTFQIYFDFSGYSDMAIGIGRMIGFRFPENFNNPYIAQSITEFWRRWHMSLGRWMKNYLYIPLGGNQVKTKFRLYFNLWIVFLLSGLWHGASWSFVVWGAWHGMFLVLERAFLNKALEKAGRLPRVIFTFFLVVIGWIFFRVENVKLAAGYVGALFGSGSGEKTISLQRDSLFILALAVFFSLFCLYRRGEAFQEKFFDGSLRLKGYVLATLAGIVLFILSLSYITAGGFNPFIYFRF